SHRLEQADECEGVLERERGRPAQPGIPQNDLGAACEGSPGAWGRRGDGWHRRGASRHVRSAVPESWNHARQWTVRAGESQEPGSAAADGSDRDRRATQDRWRKRKPTESVGYCASLMTAGCGRPFSGLIEPLTERPTAEPQREPREQQPNEVLNAHPP